ncbi:DedA family protein [Rhodococcus sp. NPDC058505]|uniref:DedA family protein n=1 Tax=unclassified Rhodococcus (in: high G+C Gram-positive bacteria) TaxID=192944 RepID=UPI00364C8EF6
MTDAYPADDASGLFSAVADWSVELMDSIGGLGAGIAIAVENLFPPIPSEVILPLAGFAAARGSMSVIEAIAWTTAGSLVGALVLYAISRMIGMERICRIADRLPLVSSDDLRKGERWFRRYGSAAVFLGRMVPLVRSAISVPAGVSRMPIGAFVLYTTLGSAIWNSIFVLAGYFLGENWAVVEEYAGVLQYVVLAAIAGAVGWYGYRKIAAARR